MATLERRAIALVGVPPGAEVAASGPFVLSVSTSPIATPASSAGACGFVAATTVKTRTNVRATSPAV